MNKSFDMSFAAVFT